MGVVMGVTEGVSSESVEGSAAFFLLPRLLGWVLLFFAGGVLPLGALVPVFTEPSEVLLELFFLFFVFSVALLLVLLLAVSSVLAAPEDLFLVPLLRFSVGSFLFDAALSFSAELLRVLVPPVGSLFVLPFLLAPPLVVVAAAGTVLSLLSGGCGSSKVFVGGNYKKQNLKHFLRYKQLALKDTYKRDQ